MACVLEQCPFYTAASCVPAWSTWCWAPPALRRSAPPASSSTSSAPPTCCLRRPISLCDVEQDTIRLVIESVGKGSQWLCERQAGELLDLLGPLGDHGFPVPDAAQGDSRPLLLVGGGVGSAPLLYCAKSSPVPVDAALGFGSAGA